MKSVSRWRGPALFVLLGHGAALAASSFTCNPEGLQQEMNACAERDYEIADAELDATYRTMLAGLVHPKRLQLQKEQRNWLKRRNSHCKEEAKLAEGGSVWQAEYFTCLTAATQRRTDVLKSRDSGVEGLTN